jgi:hypothetical protein
VKAGGSFSAPLPATSPVPGDDTIAAFQWRQASL